MKDVFDIILIRLWIVKTSGKYANGKPIKAGLNLLNPVSWLIVFVIAIIAAGNEFYKTFVYAITDR